MSDRVRIASGTKMLACAHAEVDSDIRIHRLKEPTVVKSDSGVDEHHCEWIIVCPTCADNEDLEVFVILTTRDMTILLQDLDAFNAPN